MVKKSVVIIISVTGVIIIGTGIGVLIWWFVSGHHPFKTVELIGDGVGDVEYRAAFARIRNTGDMFWWFYPTLADNPAERPIVLWLDGLTGLPPSLLANFGMFGPYDLNFNRRENSWVDEYNLLFVDAPIGTGFSTVRNDNYLTNNLDENADYLAFTLESFYDLNSEYRDAPLYIFGEGHGGQLALSLAIHLGQTDRFTHNLVGVAIGNGIISPALALTKLGFYLEEMGYIVANGRNAIENLSHNISSLVTNEELEDAFDDFLSLGEYINENAGAVAVNLGHIVEKLTGNSESLLDYFGKKKYVRDAFGGVDLNSFMDETVAPALGIHTDIPYDDRKDAAVEAFRSYFMIPATEMVEYILQNTTINVTIYNGNLDAVSNTPGQLEWVDNLQWDGQEEFNASPRITLVVNNLLEGYYRETSRLTFYWMNAAGQSVPLDSPVAMRRVLDRITNSIN